MRAGKCNGLREQVGRGRQAHAEQDRPKRDDGPIHQDALSQRPRFAHAPDHVERGFDGHHGHNRRDEQDDHADRSKPFCLRCKLVQVLEDLAVDLRRHQVRGKKILQRHLKRSEDRKRGEQRERDRRQRHERQHGGKCQAAFVVSRSMGNFNKNLSPQSLQQIRDAA